MSSREVSLTESDFKFRNNVRLVTAAVALASGIFQCEMATISSEPEYTSASLTLLASGGWTVAWFLSNRRAIGEHLPKINFFSRPQTLSRENPAQGMSRGYYNPSISKGEGPRYN